MLPDSNFFDLRYYNPAKLVGVYGSVYSNEGPVDHSAFWRAWDEFVEPASVDG